MGDNVDITVEKTTNIELDEVGSEERDNDLTEDDITKLMCLSGVKKYPMRVKCATLAWHTLTSAIENKKEEINIEKLD